MPLPHQFQGLFLPFILMTSDNLAVMAQPETKTLTTPRLSVSIVLHRGNLDHLRATLAGLSVAILAAVPDAHVYLIDQSLDQSYSEAAKAVCGEILHPRGVQWLYLEPNENAGYGAGHNIVLTRDLGRYHLILNPDVELPANWLAESLFFLEANPQVVLYASRGMNGRGEEEYLAKRYPTVGVLLLRAFGTEWLRNRFRKQLDHYELRDLSAEPSVQDVPLLSGCCLIAKTDALQSVNGFDERFFLYFEDYDLAMRMRGLGRVVRAGALQFVHHGGQASKKGLRHIMWFIAGGMRFFSRWGWRWI